MKDLYKLFLFPALAAAMFLVAWLTSAPALDELFSGERSQGQVIAMMRSYEGQNDLIIELAQDLTFHQADGDEIRVRMRRGKVSRIEFIPADGDPITFDQEAVAAARKSGKNGDDATATTVAGDVLPLAEWVDKVYTAAEGNADAIKRLIQREADRETTNRFTVVARTETARLLPDLDIPVGRIINDGLDIEAVVTPAGRVRAENAVEVRTTLTATDIAGTEEAEELNTTVRREMTRTVAGDPVELEHEDFLLHQDDYRYVFRPVFAFAAGEVQRAALANIGARQSPRGNHKFYNPVTVAYLPDSPEDALLLPDFSIPDDATPPDQLEFFERINFYLDRLNFFFEATFGRWFFPLISFIIGIVYTVVSLFLISLRIFPPKTKNADTVDEDALRQT